MSRFLGDPTPSDLDADVSLVANAFVPQLVLASIGIPLAEPPVTRRSVLDAPNTAPTEQSVLGDAQLHVDELATARHMPAHRRAAYVAGRRAMRAAMQQVAPQYALQPVLSTVRGAPSLPTGVTGSISHKRVRAIAAAAPANAGAFGIDLEERPDPDHVERPNVSKRILTAHELDAISHLDDLAHRETTLVYFALKEAVYKAIDPFVQRYVRFTEVELDVLADGSATVRLLLPETLDTFARIDGYWHVSGSSIIAVAHGVPR